MPRAGRHGHGRAAAGTLRQPGDGFERGGSEFSEKPQTQAGWINGGFFVFKPDIFDYLEGDQSILEREPLERLAPAAS